MPVNRLAQRTRLICQAHDPRLAARRRNRHKGKHMANNDVALDGGQVKIFFGTSQGGIRMFEPMKAMTRIGIVPVIEKIIVQKCAAHQGVPVDSYTHTRKHTSHANTRSCHCKHMVIHRDVTVLDKRARRAQPSSRLQTLSKVTHVRRSILDSNLATSCCVTFFHAHSPLSHMRQPPTGSLRHIEPKPRRSPRSQQDDRLRATLPKRLEGYSPRHHERAAPGHAQRGHRWCQERCSPWHQTPRARCPSHSS